MLIRTWLRTPLELEKRDCWCNGDITPTIEGTFGMQPLAYNAGVWQKYHILSPVQVFVLSSVCAVLIAAPLALASIPSDGTSMQRFLGPPRQFDPLINFGSVFVSVLPVFLSYYHLGRLGALLGLAISAVTYFGIRVCAVFIFAFELVGHSVAFEAVAYVGVCLLVSMLLFAAHMKASNSPAIRDAQRLLHLVPHLQTP